jgi:hypothetical protein
MLRKPEDITEGAVVSKIPAQYKKTLEKELEEFKGYNGTTAAMCLEFYCLTLSKRIEYVRRAFPGFRQ